MNKRLKFGIALCLIAGALGLLITSSLKDNTGSYLTIQEASAVQKTAAGKYIQMEGTLFKNSTKWDAANVILKFQLEDGKNKIDITYNGVKPDNFDSGYPIIVEGRFNNDTQFIAENVKVKCPSKYEAEAKEQPNQKHTPYQNN